MAINNSLIFWGISLAIISGLMNGNFTLPMRYLSRWAWETVWALFIIVACVVLPPIVLCFSVAHPLQVLAAAPLHAEVIALATGFIWGFGAILFGLGVSAVGISMVNTLVLATSAALGSFLPLLILAPERLTQPQGKAILLGTLTALVGMGFCGYAGIMRERSEKAAATSTRQMVGAARPIAVGLVICAGAGILSGLMNVGYSLSQGIITTAAQAGNSAFGGSTVIWLLVLESGAVANLAYCGYLWRKNRTWSNFRQARTLPLYGLAILMGVLWEGGLFAYGAAATKLGKLGPAIGWPLSLVVSLVTANCIGFVTGEWKVCTRAARCWMGAGLAILLGAIGILGWSGSLAN
jgi:L-rhamnose-H+ transport protein